jgi:hypothetical protein
MLRLDAPAEWEEDLSTPTLRRSVMCYSSCEGWNYRKDRARKSDDRQETRPDEVPEPQVQAEESRMWAYLAQLEKNAADQPDRISEKV